ncbi:NUDIX domain-containing protein [Microbacterium sp. gxy059]|uniref:NUDIX domain-containing protein n=1 Tax=Microbacterium sp. gxy059 TaxID=2957199 RepID=UPI003D97EEB9
MTTSRISPRTESTFRLASYAVCVRDGAVRLVTVEDPADSGAVVWTLPGGGVEPLEDPVDAVIREVAGETGSPTRVVRLLGVDSRVIPRHEAMRGLPHQNVVIFYEVEEPSGALREALRRRGDADVGVIRAAAFAPPERPGGYRARPSRRPPGLRSRSTDRRRWTDSPLGRAGGCAVRTARGSGIASHRALAVLDGRGREEHTSRFIGERAVEVGPGSDPTDVDTARNGGLRGASTGQERRAGRPQ